MVMAKPKPTPKPKPPKYTWVLSSEGMLCFKDPSAKQTIGKLWEVERLSRSHDETLAQATKSINAILRTIEASNVDPKRVLSFVEIRNRHFLVWARYDAVGPEDDEDEIAKALGLSPFTESDSK